MKRYKKIILHVVAMILTAVLSTTATIAYLKSQTDVVQNTFIKLWERQERRTQPHRSPQPRRRKEFR